jgi:thiol:disulfide interchange protein DsbC
MSRIFSALLLGLVCSTALSAEPDIRRLKADLGRAFPDTPMTSLKLRPSLVPGLHELELEGQVFYVSADGRFLFLGDVFDLKERVNVTEGKREELVVRLLSEMGEQNMIVIGPESPKRTVTVFTDVDCTYCAKFHLDVPELNRRGVKVRYLFFPRGGVGSESYKRAVAVWCAADRVQAIGIAKARGKISMKTCPHPVERHVALGESLGITGTPTLFLDNGKRVPGYVPPARLLALLGIKITETSSMPRPVSDKE